MKASEDLFQLVKSLTKAEKGYFRKYTASGIKDKDINYIKLFEAIERHAFNGSAYNEELIKKELENEEFIKNLPAAKIYLYETILKSLSAFYSADILNFRIKDSIQKVEILFRRGLYSQCRKILYKTKELCYEQEKYLYLIELLSWEIKIELNELNYGNKDADINSLYNELHTAEKALDNLQDYQKLFFEISAMNTKHGFMIRDKKMLCEYERFLKNELLQCPENAGSYSAKVLFYEIYIQYYNVTGNFKESFGHCRKFLDFMEAHPEKLEHNTKSYLTALNNYLIRCAVTGKDENFPAILEKYRDITIDKSEISAFLLSYNIELYYYTSRGNFNDGLPLIEKTSMYLDKYKGRYHRSIELFLWFSIAYLYFGNGNYKSCLEYINKILNDPLVKQREDVRVLALLLNLIVHYELGNYDLLDYTIKSTYRFLYTRKRIYRVESLTLSFLKKLTRIFNTKELMGMFKELKDELESYYNDPYEMKALEQFDFLSWLESKIQGKSFGEMVRTRRSGEIVR